jgi:2-polyprenyl-3-methyl-5-hydroxy-6-metoxy-1,4-benzoquinol methylase
MPCATVECFEKALAEAAPYMSHAVEKGRAFRPEWEAEFEETLARMFAGDQAGLLDAIKGYVVVALDAVRLHKRFEKELRYIHKSYADVGRAVYHNRDYMFNLYLPGILLSQYLWPHHYAQLLFFRREFVSRIRKAAAKTMADVGVGTGFYSRQALAGDPELRVTAFDISRHSLDYAEMQVTAFGSRDRWTGRQQNILTEPTDEKYPFVLSVEVLEHLEDPLSFIKGLKSMLAPGGYAFITAAVTAPHEDHIYLYESVEQVRAQLAEGGFRVVCCEEEIAYQPKNGEPVPRTGAFVCQ